MLRDQFDNPVSSDNPFTVEAINRFCMAYISYGTDFGVIFDAADQDPDCALASAHAALLATLLETPGRLQSARRYLGQAMAGAMRATTGEQLYIAAVAAAIKGDLAVALEHHKTLATEYPGDLFAAKVGQTRYFNLGDDAGMLWLADQVIDRHMDCAYAHGMRAFALEQSSRFEEAESAGRRATEMQRAEPWAHHAVAHVMLSQGRTDEGIVWMREHADEWEYCNSFMYTHNWWHLAVFHIDNDDYDAALALYDHNVWGINKPFSQDQINAISLLWRLELAGANVGGRWDDLAANVADRYLINDQPFLDMHYVYALARAGRMEQAAGFLERIEQHSLHADPMLRTVWADIALPACRAFVDIARGDHAAALENLLPAMSRLQEIGGSHAQRDLFEQVRIDSLMKCGRHDEALARLEKRLEFRDNVDSDWRLLKMAARSAGRNDLAEKAEAVLQG